MFYKEFGPLRCEITKPRVNLSLRLGSVRLGQSLGMKVGKRSLSDVTTRTKISAYIESLSSSTGRWQAA